MNAGSGFTEFRAESRQTNQSTAKEHRGRRHYRGTPWGARDISAVERSSILETITVGMRSTQAAGKVIQSEDDLVLRSDLRTLRPPVVITGPVRQRSLYRIEFRRDFHSAALADRCPGIGAGAPKMLIPRKLIRLVHAGRNKPPGSLVVGPQLLPPNTVWGWCSGWDHGSPCFQDQAKAESFDKVGSSARLNKEPVRMSLGAAGSPVPYLSG